MTILIRKTLARQRDAEDVRGLTPTQPPYARCRKPQTAHSDLQQVSNHQQGLSLLIETVGTRMPQVAWLYGITTVAAQRPFAWRDKT